MTLFSFFNRRRNGHTPDVITPDPAQVHRWLDRLSWVTQQRLQGLRQGQHTSLLRGQGLDLADLRLYQPTDDVRHIDWNASARLQHTHVRVFHEDRDLAAWFIVDASASNAFGSTGRSKHDTALAYVGVVARMLHRQGNRIGAIVHTGQAAPAGASTATSTDAPAAPSGPRRMAVLPARAGSHQLWQLTQLLTGASATARPGEARPSQAQSGGQPKEARPAHAQPGPAKPGKTRATAAAGHVTDLGAMLREAGQLIRSRAAVFVVSDFVSQPGWDDALGQIARRHDVVAVHLVDPMEWQLPDLGPIAMRDPETGVQAWVDTGDAGLRARFAQLAEQRQAELDQGFARAGVDVLELSTSEDVPQAVVRQVFMRKRALQPTASLTPAAHAAANVVALDQPAGHGLSATPAGLRAEVPHA